jgi:outer membrane lipoprotein-sorting protein
MSRVPWQRAATSLATACALAALPSLAAAADTAAAAGPAPALAAAAPAISSSMPSVSDAERLITSVEARHSKGGSLAASFTQTFRSAATGQQLVERGRLFVKRPGQMRLDYRQPDKKVFIVRADGSTLSYVPADYTAVKGRIPADAPHLRVLLGDSRLLDGFVAATVQLKQPAFPDSRQIKLTPRKATDGVEVVYLEVDAATLDVQRVLVVDALGNESDLVLDRIQEDARVQDDVFALQLPPGVMVRDASSAGGT